MLFTENISEEIFLLEKRKTIILADENTSKLCLPLLKSNLECIVIPAGEEHKKLETCELVWGKLLELGADRNTTLLCLGGGMVCDLGAFVASTFLRGMDYVLVPTSLLAMVDASIGGKCGVDFRNFKNYIGLFSQPKEIYIDTRFLKTLPSEELINGKMEMIKHGLIADKQHFMDLVEKEQSWKDHIQDSIKIKEQHVTKDFNEQGIRKRLNFGHTIGHAIESLALEKGKPLAHGLAVGIGMLAESYISYEAWSLEILELQKIEEHLRKFVKLLPAELLKTDELMKYMLKDKKNQDGQILFCLLNTIGSAQEGIQVPISKIEKGIQYLSSLR